MRKIMILIIFILCTSYIAPKELEYSSEIKEIQENIDEANHNLDVISIVINNRESKQTKKKIKKGKNEISK